MCDKIKISTYKSSFIAAIKSHKVKLEKVSKITNLSAEEIIVGLRKGSHSCKEVLNAFQCKALQAHDLTNCIVQPIREAHAAATELENCGDRSKALYGLPVSIKDNFCYKGYDSTAGCSYWIAKPFPDDCVIVKVLKHQGAIPFVKTNVPQTMLSWECTNPIYGATTHPMDKGRGVGGSSGGEAALISCKGSVLGFGTDIGGSIRIPANMCGITGLKTTGNRISAKGMFPLCKGQQACPATLGPMARDVDTLALALKALCVPKMWELDPHVPPMPFNDSIYQQKKPLKIGYYLNNGVIESTPSMQRAVLETKALLENLGHTVTEWKISESFIDMIVVWSKVVNGDKGETMIKLLEGDATDAAFGTTLTLLKMPTALKRLLAFLIKPVFPMISKMLSSSCGCGSVFEWWKLEEEKMDLISEITNSWKENEFDAVICPGFACPTVPNGMGGKLIVCASYTMLYNILNYPAGSVPVTTVTAQDEKNMDHYPIKDPFHYLLKKSMKGTVGLPVNVQVITLPWQEELCLRVMKDIETAVENQNHEK